jgi:hypothetical protein
VWLSLWKKMQPVGRTTCTYSESQKRDPGAVCRFHCYTRAAKALEHKERTRFPKLFYELEKRSKSMVKDPLVNRGDSLSRKTSDGITVTAWKDKKPVWLSRNRTRQYNF